MHSLGNDTAVNGSTALGNDSQKNTLGGAYNTSGGQASMREGAPQNSTAFGSAAMRGNSGSIIISGSVTSGDVVSITLTASGTGKYAVTGSPFTASCTAGSGGCTTLAGIASTLATQLNGVFTIMSGGSAVPVTSSGSFSSNYVIDLTFPGNATTGLQILPTVSVTGSATEVLTVGGGAATQYMTALGRNAIYGLALSNAQYDTAVGDSSLSSITSGNYNTGLGANSCEFLTSTNDNTCIGFDAGQFATGSDSVFVGFQAGYSVTNPIYNTLIGAHAGYNITTGGYNTALGQFALAGAGAVALTGTSNVAVGAGAMQNCQGACASNVGLGTYAFQVLTTGASNTAIGNRTAFANLTTGSYNVLIGTSATGGVIDTPAATTNGWLNIGGTIVGNRTALTSSAESSCGTGPSINAQADDLHGTITTGTGATACTLTFGTARSAAPTCIVTARSGTAPAYTTSTTALTLSTAAASATYDYFCTGS